MESSNLIDKTSKKKYIFESTDIVQKDHIGYDKILSMNTSSRMQEAVNKYLKDNEILRIDLIAKNYYAYDNNSRMVKLKLKDLSYNNINILAVSELIRNASLIDILKETHITPEFKYDYEYECMYLDCTVDTAVIILSYLYKNAVKDNDLTWRCSLYVTINKVLEFATMELPKKDD